MLPNVTQLIRAYLVRGFFFSSAISKWVRSQVAGARIIYLPNVVKCPMYFPYPRATRYLGTVGQLLAHVW